MTANCNCAIKTVQSGLAAMYRLDGMVYAVGTGVATALKVVQRHSPLRVKPEGKKVRIRAVDLVV